jgi:hypothetical protein
MIRSAMVLLRFSTQATWLQFYMKTSKFKFLRKIEIKSLLSPHVANTMIARYATKDTVFNCPTWRHLEINPEPVRRPVPLVARVIIATLETVQTGCVVLGCLLVIGFVVACLRS